MNANQQYKFMTPAETLIRLTRDITSRWTSKASIAGSHYHEKCEYLKMKELLRLALAGQLGAVSEEERRRIDASLLKLDEMYEENRRLSKPNPGEKSPGLF